MISVEKILFLRNVSLFAGMAPAELGHLAGIAEEVVFSEGSEIIHEGDHGDTMFLIVDGEVGIVRGKEALAVLKTRDYFGEMSILDGEPRSASAVARTDCLLLRINQRDFYGILRRHFEAALTIIQTLTRRLRGTQNGAPPTRPPR